MSSFAYDLAWFRAEKLAMQELSHTTAPGPTSPQGFDVIAFVSERLITQSTA